MVREGFTYCGQSLQETHRNRQTKWEDGNVWENRGVGEAAVSQWMPEILGDGRNLQYPLQAHALISRP